MGILCVFCVYDTIGNRCFEKTSFPKNPFTPRIARTDVSKMQNNQTIPHCIFSIETGK